METIQETNACSIQETGKMVRTSSHNEKYYGYDTQNFHMDQIRKRTGEHAKKINTKTEKKVNQVQHAFSGTSSCEWQTYGTNNHGTVKYVLNFFQISITKM